MVPWTKMPDVLGLTWRAAVPKVAAAGVPEGDVHAEAAYLNDTLPREGEYDDWRVCRQDPASVDPLTDEVYVVSLGAAAANGAGRVGLAMSHADQAHSTPR
ncbi:hypothetical protein ABZO31_00250 [Streptomyces sp. HUAS MG47]|uniref:hypothetical protein n=1 Tax=Streptomyces solicamelliae TaxID=3231716 RepID=UPI00387837C8